MTERVPGHGPDEGVVRLLNAANLLVTAEDTHPGQGQGRGQGRGQGHGQGQGRGQGRGQESHGRHEGIKRVENATRLSKPSQHHDTWLMKYSE